MTSELVFWILMLLWAVFYLVGFTPQGAIYWGRGGWVLLFFIILLLGWKVMGPPIH